MTLPSMNADPAPADSASPYVDAAQKSEAQHLGMWTFLTTEILFFGGLFACYAIYRSHYPKGFVEGSHHLDFGIGTVNTVVLLTSSLCVALGDYAVRMGRERVLMRWLAAAWLLGAAFVALKGYEYWVKYYDHFIPGAGFHGEGPHAAEVELFMVLYFVMTGLHAVHMIAGLAALAWLGWLARRGRVSAANPAPVEMVGLYWHFVDAVWVFLYPLLYLIRS